MVKKIKPIVSTDFLNYLSRYVAARLTSVTSITYDVFLLSNLIKINITITRMKISSNVDYTIHFFLFFL